MVALRGPRKRLLVRRLRRGRSRRIAEHSTNHMRSQPAKSTQTSEVIDQSRRRLPRHCGSRPCGPRACRSRPCECRCSSASARVQHVVRDAEADRRRPPECRIRRSRSSQRASPVILLHGWPYDIQQLRRRRPLAGFGGLPGHGCPTCEARHDTLPFRRDVQERTAGGACCRCHRLHGCPQDRQGDPRTFRLRRRTANIVAALWPERCKAPITVSGYAVPNVAAQKLPLPPAGELQLWYQYYSPLSAARSATTNTGAISASSSHGSLLRKWAF